MRALTKIAGSLILAVALAASASAQTVGVKGGWAHPTLAGNDASGSSALNTVAGGGFAALNLSPLFALQLEALYAPKGAQDNSTDINGKLKVGYIEVPLFAKLLLPAQRSQVKPTVFAGPYIGFKASCNIEGTSSNITASMSCTDAGLPIKSTDFGLSFGGGVGFPLGTRVSGLLEARYDLGLSKIFDSTPQADIKNRSLMVFAGVSVPVGSGRPAATIRER